MSNSDETITRILRGAKTVAVVGLSSDPTKPSAYVAEYLQRAGYRIIPVNPTADRLLGEPVYPSLADVKEPVDLVDVFRPPAACPEVARQAVAMGAKALWLQSGIISEEAAEIARKGGLEVVMDRCTMVEHRRRA
jgi:uncharacterized protein